MGGGGGGHSHGRQGEGGQDQAHRQGQPRAWYYISCVQVPSLFFFLWSKAFPFLLPISYFHWGVVSSSVADPDPHGSGSFVWIRIRIQQNVKEQINKTGHSELFFSVGL